MTKRAVIITTSILAGLIMIVTILFGVVFRVRDIQIVCDDEFYYTAQIDDILLSSKLKKNVSIFDIDRKKISTNIETNYPYARVQGINLDSFTKIKISLGNRTPLYYFVENEICFILDEDCKVLEKVTLQEYNDNNYKYILLNNVFSADEDIVPGHFIDGKYASICDDLYNALYSSAMIEKDDGEGGFKATYLDREDMCDFISGIAFNQSYELKGKVDNLIITTSFGVKMSIIEPQNNLNDKINMAFSAFRVLQQRDRANGSALTQAGSINVIYTYDANKNASTVCEYRA